jgi:tetratricopeptide (TPR) repeat protein
MKIISILFSIAILFPTFLFSNTEKLFDTYDYACTQDKNGNTQVAIKMFESIIDNKYATKGLIVESYNKIGLINLRLLNYNEAVSDFKTIKNLDGIDSISCGYAILNIGAVYRQQCLYNKALGYYKSGYNILSQLKDPLAYKCNYDIAAIYIDLYEYFKTSRNMELKNSCLDSASKYINLAVEDCKLQISLKSEDPKSVELASNRIAHINALKGEVNVIKGNYMEAISVFYSAIENSKSGFNIDIIEYYFLQLANIQISKMEETGVGNLESMNKNLNIARTNIDSTETRFLAHYYYKYAQYLYFSSNYIDAINYIDSARVLFERLGGKLYLSKSSHLLAHCYKNLGNIDDYSDELDYSYGIKQEIWASSFVNGQVVAGLTDPFVKGIDNESFFESFNLYIFPMIILLLLSIIAIQYKKSSQYNDIINEYDKGIADTADIMRELTTLEHIDERTKNVIKSIISIIKSTPYNEEPNNVDSRRSSIVSSFLDFFSRK